MQNKIESQTIVYAFWPNIEAVFIDPKEINNESKNK